MGGPAAGDCFVLLQDDYQGSSRTAWPELLRSCRNIAEALVFQAETNVSNRDEAASHSDLVHPAVGTHNVNKGES